MPIAPKDILRTYLQTGDKPTAAQFSTLIDSTVNLIDDRYLLGLHPYVETKNYVVDDSTIYGSALYLCIADTTGPFDPVKWKVIASLGSAVYSGVWDAINNAPALASGVGTKGYYYVVSNASSIPSENTMLDGIDDWGVSDWVIFNGTVWQKVDNTEAPVKASNVSFQPTSTILSDNVQDAIVEVETNTETALATKQNLLSLTPNFYPYANGTSSLADGVISNQSDGIALNNGKVFRSSNAGHGTIEFGKDGNSVIASTDASKGADSILKLDPGKVTLTNKPSGSLIITPGSDNKGDVELKNSTGNGVSITSDAVALIETQGGGAVVKLSSNLIEINAATLDIEAAQTSFSALTADTVPYIDSSNIIVSSSVTPVELGYLSGVTSSIQTQFNSVVTLASSKVSKSGDTMTGYLILNDDPTSDLGAATKQYVDAVQTDTDTKVPLAGGTMTGDLVLFGGAPATSASATPKSYVDTNITSVQNVVNTKVSKAGDTMTGDLVLSTTGTPATNASASSKAYVDTKLPLTGGTLTGDLVLYGSAPASSSSAVPRSYVDSNIATIQAALNTKVSKSGDTMTGDLILSTSGTPSTASSAASKNYVDTKLPLTGGTLTGDLVLYGSAPAGATSAVPKSYVDSNITTVQTSISTKVSKSGDTMSGDLILSTSGTPATSASAASKGYTDTKVSKAGDTMTGDLVLSTSGTPATASSAASKNYVDTKVSKAGDTMTGDLILSTTGTPATAASAASKNYVDTKFSGVPSQTKVICMPFTFDGAYGITNPVDTWGRIGLEVTIPLTSNVFPTASSFTATLIVDYNTTNSGTTGRVSLVEWNNNSSSSTPVTGTDNAVVSTSNTWTRQTFSFAAGVLSGGKTYSVMIMRSGSSGSMQLEGATLVLTYS